MGMVADWLSPHGRTYKTVALRPAGDIRRVSYVSQKFLRIKHAARGSDHKITALGWHWNICLGEQPR